MVLIGHDEGGFIGHDEVGLVGHDGGVRGVWLAMMEKTDWT